MIKTKVLIVEDETIVALDIKNALINLGFEVTNTVTNFDDAIKSVKTNKPTIVLIDIYLKNSKDGIVIVEEIQRIENLPIIYLTAYSDEKTIERAIKTDPIGYLLKPFKKEELKSTILLGLYKMNKQNQTLINKNAKDLGFNYYYDILNEILFYKNIPIKLSINERKLITILIEAKGNIVSFSNIEYLIWSDLPVSNSTLRTLIYRLRAKLEYKLIETVPGIGCKLTPKF